MKFDDLDAKMRLFETAHDHHVLPGIHMVARIDGRGFTRLTKEVCSFEAPFDARFRDLMTATTEHLMACGFRVIYGYTQSDEISLLFHVDDSSFDRKLRKFDSVLAGEASAAFALKLGRHAAMDCRISQLPSKSFVIEYFRWRQEDAFRNALNAHCYWMQRRAGMSATDATHSLKQLSTADKNELLFQKGINFNDLPNWQKRGIGVYWETFAKEGLNPVTGKLEQCDRRRLKVEYNLPMRDEYEVFVRNFMEN